MPVHSLNLMKMNCHREQLESWRKLGKHWIGKAKASIGTTAKLHAMLSYRPPIGKGLKRSLSAVLKSPVAATVACVCMQSDSPQQRIRFRCHHRCCFGRASKETSGWRYRMCASPHCGVNAEVLQVHKPFSITLWSIDQSPRESDNFRGGLTEPPKTTQLGNFGGVTEGSDNQWNAAEGK